MVEDVHHLKQHMTVNSGVEDCFTSVYSFFQGKPVIDKVFFDIDYGTPAEALKTGQRIFEWCTENGIPTMCLWSGSRGPHIYPLLRPSIYDKSQSVLKNLSYHIINETQSYTVEDGKKVSLCDPCVIGDLRRLCRYPNTQRTSQFKTPLPQYCIPLNPERFLDMNIKEVLDLSHSPQTFKLPSFKLPTKSLSDYISLKADLTEFRASRSELCIDVSGINYTNSPKSQKQKLLARLLFRPCVRNFILSNNPPSIIRYAAVVELRKIGLSPERIFELFEACDWHDWDYDETAYQIEMICSKEHLKPVGKTRLKELGLCPENETYCKSCR